MSQAQRKINGQATAEVINELEVYQILREVKKSVQRSTPCTFLLGSLRHEGCMNSERCLMTPVTLQYDGVPRKKFNG